MASGTAKRIQALRKRTGKSIGEIASLVGLGDMAYFDLETYDDELVTVLSLEQVRRLGDALGVSTQMLFSDQPTPAEFRSNSYDDLVSLVRAHIVRAGSKEAVENALGWELDAFLESEATALSSYSAEFLQALCAHVGVDWMTALP
jgi:transcriptional regulator with XRE-family HTH domain